MQASLPRRILFPQQLRQAGHTFGGAFADQGQRIADARRIGITGIDDIDRDSGAHAAHQRRGGIDRQRSPHDHHDIRRPGNLRGTFEHRHRLAEKDDVRTQQRPVGRRGVELLLPPLDRDDQIGIARRAQAGQFAVQVGHFRRAGTLVQVVYVLWQNIINSCQLWKKRKNEIKY